MASRKAFLLRIDPTILDAVQKWANDDLRSLNGQIEFLLRRALRETRRMRPPPSTADTPLANSGAKDPATNNPQVQS